MIAYTVDTLATARELEQAGFQPKQAEVVATLVARREQQLTTKDDLKVLKVDINVLKDDMKTLRADMKALRSELKADMEALRSELKADMKALRDELKSDMDVLGKSLRHEMSVMRWWMGIQSAFLLALTLRVFDVLGSSG